MSKLRSLLCLSIAFLFIACYAESITDSLPKEFFDNADFYSKLEMIENLTVLETVNERELQLISQKSNDDSVGEAQ